VSTCRKDWGKSCTRRIPQNVLTVSRKVHECKPLDSGEYEGRSSSRKAIEAAWDGQGAAGAEDEEEDEDDDEEGDEEEDEEEEGAQGEEFEHSDEGEEEEEAGAYTRSR